MKRNSSNLTYAEWLSATDDVFRRNAYGAWLTSCHDAKALKRAWHNGFDPTEYALLLASYERERARKIR